MYIELVNENQEQIAIFELPCSPFTVGEIIKVKKNILLKDFWTFDEMDASFKIEKIAHSIRLNYGRSVTEHFTTTLTVLVHETN